MDLVPLAGDVGLLVEAGDQLLVIPRPRCEEFSLLVIDHGPSQPDLLSGIFTLTVQLGPAYVAESLSALNSHRANAGQPVLKLPTQLLCRISTLLPVPVGQNSAGVGAVDVVFRPGSGQTVQFRLGREAVMATLALIQLSPTWTPQVNISALVADFIPLSVRTSLQPIKVRRQRIRNALFVSLPSGTSLELPEFVIAHPNDEDRHLIPSGGITIDTLSREPFDYYVEWAADNGIANVVSGHLSGWEPDEVTYLQLPVASRTVKITPAGLDKVGAIARLFLLIVQDSGGGLRLAAFEDEARTNDVLQKILCESGTELTEGILIGFDETGTLCGVRAANANDIVGFSTVFVSILANVGDLSSLLIANADSRWRQLLSVTTGGDAEAAYHYYFPDLLKSTFPDLDPASSPAPGWLKKWANYHNRTSSERIRAFFPLLGACCALGQSNNAQEATLALNAMLDTSAARAEPTKDIANAVVTAFLVRGSFLQNIGPAVVQACLEFPAAVESIIETKTLLAIGLILQEPQDDALDILAFKLYSRATASGDLTAKTALGICYAEGRGVVRDLAKAEALFRDSTAHPDAKYRLGRLLIQKGNPLSIAEGIGELSDAASSGSIDAMVTLGSIYELGEHQIPQDLAKARGLFTSAAAAGSVQGKTRLGLFYKDGIGVPIDNVEAAALLLEAAMGGVPDAQFAYAEMLDAGSAVSATPNVGPEYFFRLAAHQGHAAAMSQALRLGGIRLAEMGVALASPASTFQAAIANYAITFARLGKTERARGLVGNIPDASLRRNTMAEIAVVAAKQGDFAMGTAIVNDIEDAAGRDGARMSIALVYCDEKRFAEASALIATIGESFYREQSLVQLANSHAKAGQVQEAKAVAAQVVDTFQNKMALVAIASGLTERGDFSSATLIVQNLDGGRWLVNVAWAQLKAGDKSGALLTTAGIQDEGDRGRAYGGIARVLVEAGSLDDARDVAILGPSSFERTLALIEIIIAYAKNGEFAKASTLLSQIPVGPYRNGATGSLAIIQAMGGQVDQALALAISIPSDDLVMGVPYDNRPSALGFIAGIRIQTQGVQAALDVLNQINALDARRVQIYTVARGRAEKGDIANANAILTGLPDHPGKQDGINAIMSLAAASATQYDSAIDRVNLIADPLRRSSALREVIGVLARAKEFIKARDLVDTLQDGNQAGGNDKSWSLSDIAISLFDSERIEDALETANSIPAQSVRSYTVSKLHTSIHKLLTTGSSIDAGLVLLASSIASQSRDALVRATISLAERHLSNISLAGTLDNLDRGEAIMLSSDDLSERVSLLGSISGAYSRLVSLVRL